MKKLFAVFYLTFGICLLISIIIFTILHLFHDIAIWWIILLILISVIYFKWIDYFMHILNPPIKLSSSKNSKKGREIINDQKIQLLDSAMDWLNARHPSLANHLIFVPTIHKSGGFERAYVCSNGCYQYQQHIHGMQLAFIYSNNIWFFELTENKTIGDSCEYSLNEVETKKPFKQFMNDLLVKLNIGDF